MFQINCQLDVKELTKEFSLIVLPLSDDIQVSSQPNKDRNPKMSVLRKSGEEIRNFILENVKKHPKDISQYTASHFKLSRQAINKHISKLVDSHALEAKGKTRERTYNLKVIKTHRSEYSLESKIEEHRVWQLDLAHYFEQLPDNVKKIWYFGFTEILNNAIDHSGGKVVEVTVLKDAVSTSMIIRDDGVGIFNKIQAELDLLDPRHSVLELSKGKFTSDPTKHSGEGIFWTSRIFDHFMIFSRGVIYQHQYKQDEDWMFESKDLPGTTVYLVLKNYTSRTLKKVIKEFTSSSDHSFSKTVVSMSLAQYGDEFLVSRSQAKRVLARVDLFKTVIFDFKGVSQIGQAFADEIFRVFALAHPEIKILHVHGSEDVKLMIARAENDRTGRSGA